ncbi:MAG: SDR family oxidoreductase [Acidobacteria bacterium]|nr:SDR family oxidoreductase [Acidobacteriota bacterium]
MPLSGPVKTALMVAGGLGAALAASSVSWPGKDEDIRGQAALITGGSRGLGFMLARELAHQGCRLAICARDVGELDRATRLLQQEDAEVYAFECDISRQEQVDNMIRAAEGRLGHIDILVNNAGVIVVGPIQTMTREDFETAMNTMFWGTLWPTMAVLPGMQRRQAGRIANITSIGGRVSVPHLIPYGCAKFACVGLSEGLRAELAKDGIAVTTVVPGLMRTGSHVNAFFKGKQEAEYAWFSLGAALPIFSINAERAARTIVRAVKARQAEITLSVPASVLARFHGLFPGVTADLMAWMNHFVLPESVANGKTRLRGADLESKTHPVIQSLLSVFGDFAEPTPKFHTGV